MERQTDMENRSGAESADSTKLGLSIGPVLYDESCDRDYSFERYRERLADIRRELLVGEPSLEQAEMALKRLREAVDELKRARGAV